MENTAENFDVGWSGRSKNGRGYFKLILCCILLLAPKPNFIKIRWKTQKLTIFAIGRFWSVGLVGKNRIHSVADKLEKRLTSPEIFFWVWHLWTKEVHASRLQNGHPNMVRISKILIHKTHQGFLFQLS